MPKHFSAFLFAATAACSQSIQGLVTDPSAARVAGANVQVLNSATQLERRTVTDSTGFYSLTALPPGDYLLRIEKPGFFTHEAPVNLTANQSRQIDIQINLAQTTQSGTVRADAPLLETANATLSGLIDRRRVVDLPLNGRNFSQLINLQPGVALISSQGLLGGGPDSSGIQGSGMYVNGARGGHNNYLFDGVDANDPVVPSGTGASTTAVFTGGAPGINGISVDAIQEFRVITSSAPAEFGRSSGAVINVVTKSGTNQLHGALFHFLRNRALNARNTFEATKPGFTQNNFGGTAGGRLRKDRTFFFGGYEGFRQRQSVTAPVIFPSANTLAAIKRQNPLLGTLAEAYYAPIATPVAADRPVENILADNIPVTGTRFLPKPNGFNQGAWLGRLDQRTPRDGWFTARYQLFNGEGIPGTISSQAIPGSSVGYENRSQNVMLAEVQPLGPRTLLEGRLAMQRNTPRATFEATPAAVLQAGRLRAQGPYAGQPYGAPDTDNGIPTINLGYGLTPIGYETTAPNRRGVTTYQGTAALTLIRGAHSVKTGFEMRRVQENSVFSFRLRPDVTFNSAGPNTILQPGAPVATYDQNVFFNPATSQRGFRVREWAGYVQDNWRATRRLTLDYGVRYEFFGRPWEVNGYLNNAFLAPNGTPQPHSNQLSNGGVTGLNQIRLFPVGKGRPYDFYPADKNNFAPRFGLAYDTHAGILRAGYGIFYDRLFNNVFGNARVSPPYTLPVFITNQPFGATPAIDPFTTTIGISPVTIDPSFRNAYTQRFNLSFQRAIGSDTVVEAAYVGARALRLVRTLRLNQGAVFPLDFRPANIDVPDRPRTASDFRPINLANMSTRDSSGASTYHSLQLTAQRRFARRYSWQAAYTLGHSQDIASGEILTDLVVTSITNTLPLRNADGLIPTPTLANVNQVRTQRGLAPFTTTADAARWFNQSFTGANQWRADIGNSAFDIRHTLVANGTWELPWFQISAIGRWQSGVPFALSTGLDVNGDGNAPDRAAILANGTIVNQVGRNAFVPSVLARGVNNQIIRRFASGAVAGVSENPADVSSYMKRGALHGPPLRVVDLSVSRKINIKEAVALQLRAELFNLLNTTNFNPPVTTLTSPLFGQLLSTSTPSRQLQFGVRLEF